MVFLHPEREERIRHNPATSQRVVTRPRARIAFPHLLEAKTCGYRGDHCTCGRAAIARGHGQATRAREESVRGGGHGRGQGRAVVHTRGQEPPDY